MRVARLDLKEESHLGQDASKNSDARLHESRKRNLLVVAEKYGRLGNRIVLFAHMIACARENNCKVLNPAFSDYAHYFESTCRDYTYRYPPGQKRWPAVFSAIFRLYNELLLSLSSGAARVVRRWGIPSNWKSIEHRGQESLALNDPGFQEILRHSSILFLQGWLFRDHLNFKKHQETIRAYFQPSSRYLDSINTPIQSLRNQSDVVVGVLIRHGDYKVLFDQRYFFDLDTYLSIMEKMLGLLAPQKVSFFICSDEEQDTEKFRDLTFYFRSVHPIENMYSLAYCDYLISPPSTFTAWASFYGKVPLYFIEDPANQFSLHSFHVRCG